MTPGNAPHTGASGGRDRTGARAHRTRSVIPSGRQGTRPATPPPVGRTDVHAEAPRATAPGRAPTTGPTDRRTPAGRPALLRRLLPPGRPAPDGGSTTAHDLAVRHRLLLVLSALLTLSLFLSYEGVHGDANPLRTSSAPAVLSIDTALYALGQAQRDAGAAAPTSDFQKQISVAAQSLAAAAGDGVGGPAGRQALQTVAGLITVYAVKVQKAQLQPDGSVLREAYLSYATSVLTDEGSGIQARLKALQAQQRAAVHRQTSFGPLLWLGWTATVLLALALGAALLETQLFLRRRFRRRYNRGLLAAGALLAAGLAATLLFTVWTHQGMAHTRDLLDRPLTGRLITDAGRTCASYLAHTGFRASAAVWILIGGILLMALAETGLRRHIDDYRFRPR
ncbi:hypothetical protein FB563_0614 [Streptomyces puniciscabiei]|uniref:Uncharacterized protein n=2 Tax=Streptomyces puniciscabiei TaxID=164348 RepID=A0A542U9F5_9ACTN|nr:hypothetical protein [Streptomyces puniciscabiei]TQK95696.1 hypothetical protein FB563_0614 [Streptomyces puniciscabiei]